MLCLSHGLFSSIRGSVFQHMVILLLTGCFRGQSQRAPPPVRMVTLVGEDVVLPCLLEPPLDAVSKSVEWGRPDLQPRFVHVWHEGRDFLVNQNPSYKGRTSVSMDKLRQGDLSLLLSAVKLSDNGLYRCYFPSKDKISNVELVVGSLSTPVISTTKYNSSFIDSQCESSGWYPEPEVLWLDGEGNLLSAGPTETVRGPDDLYTVSSRVTVEKRHSNSFTCRVQQNHINQIRETNIQISADCFEFTSCSAHVAVLVVFVLLLLLAAACVVWKWRQIQTKERKKQQEDQAERKKLLSEKKRTEEHEEELQKKEQMLQEKEETWKKTEEKLKKTEEMLKKTEEMLKKTEEMLKKKEDFEQEVHSKLSEQSDELKKQRDKLRQQQRDMETNIKDIEKEMQSVEKMAEGERFPKMKEITLTAKTQLNKRKQEDEKLHLQTTTILSRTTEMLKKIPDRKKEEPEEESQ